MADHFGRNHEMLKMYRESFLTPDAWEWTQKILRFDENIDPFERLEDIALEEDRLETLRRAN